MKTFTDFIEEIFEEEEDERDKPDRNVVMQARKAVNMGGKKITFQDGKSADISRSHAQKFLNKHTKASSDNKLSIQNHAQQSHKNFMSHTEEVENVDEISADKLSSYTNKASDASKYKNMSTKKVDNRYTGVAAADDKMAKAGHLGTTAQKNSNAKVPAGNYKEELKAIDKTGSYISKKETAVAKEGTMTPMSRYDYAEHMANAMKSLLIKDTKASK
tara:strand:- start:1495 stop:2145 length:651 start_codon:yes stop_codon:yes gene_type:complete